MIKDISEVLHTLTHLNETMGALTQRCNTLATLVEKLDERIRSIEMEAIKRDAALNLENERFKGDIRTERAEIKGMIDTNLEKSLSEAKTIGAETAMRIIRASEEKFASKMSDMEKRLVDLESGSGLGMAGNSSDGPQLTIPHKDA